MKNRYSIQEAAKLAGMTSETLRHYDRIGLVLPHEKDPWTGYRYYTERELVLLNTVQALQLMDLPLKEIKRVLQYDSLEEVVAFLRETEHRADRKIARLREAKAKIGRARADYEKKLTCAEEEAGFTVRELPERAILLSQTLEQPTLDNLWRYLDHFYEQVGEARRGEYEFEDVAGVYAQGGRERLFAVSRRFPADGSVTVLPCGEYLCANCTGESREAVLESLVKSAREEYGAEPPFTVQLVVVSGILQWGYQIQVPLF